MWNTWKTIIY